MTRRGVFYNTEKRILYHVLRRRKETEAMPHGKESRRRIALVMGLADTYEHGIARGVVRYAKALAHWDLYGYGRNIQP